MASVIKKTQEETAQAKNTQAAQTAQAAQATETAQTQNAQTGVGGTGLKGVSENTAAKLNQYSGGYRQGSGVQAAQNYLNGVLSNKPTADAQLSDLYDRIMNREQFSYDLNADALYQQYKDKYQQQGKQAMLDTMGNATALTGGYGSSYASTAGNQAYQQYLQQLNDVVPELYDAAYNRYVQEGTDLQNQYGLAYDKYRNAMSDWESERDYADSNYWTTYNADYSDYENMLNYWNQMAQLENSAYYTERDYAYNLAMAMIKRGKMPSDEMLEAAGMTQSDAIKLGAKTGSSSSKSKKSGGTATTTSTDTTTDAALADAMYRADAIAARSDDYADTYNRIINQYIKNKYGT